MTSCQMVPTCLQVPRTRAIRGTPSNRGTGAIVSNRHTRSPSPSCKLGTRIFTLTAGTCCLEMRTAFPVGTAPARPPRLPQPSTSTPTLASVPPPGRRGLAYRRIATVGRCRSRGVLLRYCGCGEDHAGAVESVSSWVE